MSMSNAAVPTAERKVILLVEDEALVAMAEARTLERHGYAVRTVTNGEAAVAEGFKDGVDLILMDIDLGGGSIDGTRAAQQILEKREVPIVFLTSHNEREMVERVRGITRYGYVLKNSGEFVLIQSIETAFELFDARRSLQIENEIRSRTEEKLTERNAFIETILDNLPIGLAVNYIEDGRASYLNKQFESIYGWPKEIIADIPTFFESVYPDEEHRKHVYERIMTDIASGDPDRMAWRGVQITRESGETAFVDAVNIPIHEQNFMISTVIDVTERRRALSALAESEARYRAVTRSLPNGMIALYDSELRCVMAGGSELETGSLTEHDLVGKRLRDIYPKDIADRDEPSLRAALKGESTDRIVEHEGRYHRVITAPVSDGELIHHGLVLTQDITESQIARQEYRRVLEKLNLAIETAELGVWSRDTVTGHLEWNDELLRIYGLSRREFEENPDAWRAVHPDDLAFASAELGRIRQGDRVRDVRFRIHRPDGEVRHVAASGVPVWNNETITTLIGISVDITDAVERQQQLADAMARQETAVRESNHRIKNNLLTVLSLIDLAEHNDLSFSNVKRQINAFVAVHDALGRAEHLGHVEIRSLLHEIAEPHMAALRGMGGRLTIESAEHLVDSRRAVPIVLIVNELLANAIRHGVRPDAGDYVRISVCPTGDEIRFVVANSGAPFPDGVPDSETGSIGWKIIRALGDQVGASISVVRDPHTSITVSVPVVSDPA